MRESEATHSPGVLRRIATNEYRVPERFGLLAMLATVTTFALLFGGLRALENMSALDFLGQKQAGAANSVHLYLVLGSLAVAIFLVQMRFARMPRGASVAVGAVLFPFWALAYTVLGIQYFHLTPSAVVAGLPFIALVGAVGGYLMGTVAAGIFLVLDFVGGWLRPHSS